MDIAFCSLAISVSSPLFAYRSRKREPKGMDGVERMHGREPETRWNDDEAQRVDGEPGGNRNGEGSQTGETKTEQTSSGISTPTSLLRMLVSGLLMFLPIDRNSVLPCAGKID